MTDITTLLHKYRTFKFSGDPSTPHQEGWQEGFLDCFKQVAEELEASLKESEKAKLKVVRLYADLLPKRYGQPLRALLSVELFAPIEQAAEQKPVKPIDFASNTTEGIVGDSEIDWFEPSGQSRNV